jgi:polyhydroxyalkanoate synthesis repressor PhaR
MSDQKKTGSQHSGAKAGASAKASANGAQGRVVIKKYANRRLYNTASSSYVTLEHLSEMVKEGVDFVVFDAKTNEDITRSVLTQIIFDEESRGQNLLPIQFLRQLIGFYGNSMQAFLPSYLELSLDSFTRQQERMRTQMGAIAPGLAQGLAPNLGAGLGTAAGPQFLEDQVKQNLAMFDRAMKMFSPFAYVRPEDSEVAAPAAPAPAATDDSLNDLKKKIEEMQEQISRLASKG